MHACKPRDLAAPPVDGGSVSVRTSAATEGHRNAALMGRGSTGRLFEVGADDAAVRPRDAGEYVEEAAERVRYCTHLRAEEDDPVSGRRREEFVDSPSTANGEPASTNTPPGEWPTKTTSK